MRRKAWVCVLGAMGALGLAACGQGNIAALKREAVACSAYVTALNERIVEGDPAFAERIMAHLADPASADVQARREEIDRAFIDLSSKGETYREGLEIEPEALAALEAEQVALARVHAAEDRSVEAAERVAVCVDAWKRLKR